MQAPLRILLADDQSIMLDGLEAMLAKEEGFKVVGKAVNGAQAVELSKALAPDVVVMDINMPEMDGIEATKRIMKCCPNTRVLALSMYNHREFVRELVDAGAHGYVLKNTGKEELLKALLTVSEGIRYLGDDVEKTLEQPDRFKDREGEVDYHALTKREKEVVKLICEEYSSQQIAEKLFISTQTVETHRKNILHKLDIRNSVGLVKYAMERGWG